MSNENNPWGTRIKKANRYYDEWENRYKCKRLEDYYKGKHWRNQDSNYNPYVINLVYATIKIKEASYLFAHPKFVVSSSPSGSDWDIDTAAQSANLKEDALNTIVGNPRGHFKREMELAFLDSFFRFGVVEVGYGADWITNPMAGKPLLKSHEEDVSSYKKDTILRQPDELPTHERIYFKRINAKRFRVGDIDSAYIERCNWVGYYDFVFKSDLLKLKGLKNKDKLGDISAIDTESSFVSGDENDKEIHRSNSDIIKVWHIWNSRSKERLLLSDNYEELSSTPFKRLPLFTFSWDSETSGFYPIPPVFQWVSPQDEINEAREQLRSHRRRFTRKFQVIAGSVEQEELDKFLTGPDGTVVKVNRENAIVPIQNADLGASVDKAFMLAKDDMNIITGTSSEQRGVGDRVTATQSQIIDKRSTIREDYEESKLSEFISEMGREALLLAHEKFSTGIWVQISRDPGEQFLGEVQAKGPIYKWVSSEQLDDGYDFKISVDIVSLSPASQETEMKKFITFISIVNQYPQISLSPILIREAAYRCGYRNERVIKEMQQKALLLMLGQQAQNEAAGMTTQSQQPQAPMGQQALAQNTPGISQIQDQIQNQNPMVQ